MTDAPHAALTRRDGVLTVTFDRQDKLNAISPQMAEMMREAVRTLASDEELRVLVIRAVGAYFTAGFDITHINVADRTPSQYRRECLEHTSLYDALESIDKPVVLAAQGPCFGAGVEMAASCDFRFASTTATFQLPEINLAVIPGSGGISRVTRLVGPQWAKWLAMAGQPIDAERALAIGLVHEVCPAEELHDRVDAFAGQLAALPREAVGVAKLTIDLCTGADPASARHIEHTANAVLAFGDEHKRRVTAFNERNKRRGN